MGERNTQGRGGDPGKALRAQKRGPSDSAPQMAEKEKVAGCLDSGVAKVGGRG